MLDAFFVARASDRPLGEMPGITETEVSVVTLAALTLGALWADDSDQAARVATLGAVESRWDPLSVDAGWLASSLASCPPFDAADNESR